tara:strand:+ start:267 stop:449 length:183 start_codon:yes stop_codon:yes gene_type:complete
MGKSRRIIPRLKFTSPFTSRRGFKGRQADEVDIADEFDEFSEAIRKLTPRHNSHWRVKEE